jgi:phosphoenolpyruvate-protein phosphotransferase (PTS system enzyme I)
MRPCISKVAEFVFGERVNDVRDVERLLLEQLTGQPMATLNQLSPEAIVVSHDLTPGEKRHRLIATRGAWDLYRSWRSWWSHCDCCQGMEIPAVVGVGNFLHNIRTGDEVIVDGHLGGSSSRLMKTKTIT